ncbi:hypothetical protein P3T29_005053 [Kitasatospora sp. MAP5-34]|nr:hypothetical protein [Kitasatospora sp. MAP5-34]
MGYGGVAAETGQGWESVLDSVVVYATGALCRRRARVTVPPDGRVRLTGLPRALDPGSLRASVVGGDGRRVTEARLAEDAELRGPDGLPELRRLAEQARDALDAAEARHTLQLGRIDEVAALRPVPPPPGPDEPHRRTPADAWLDLADFVDERLTALHARAARLADELRQAEHALAVAQERLDRASSAGPSRPVETSATAILTLSGAGEDEDELELEVEYGVPGAVWVPTYRLSHRQGAGDGTLVLCASVAQRTGEDWTGVRLALSTADLRRRTDLPQLRSIRIGRRQPAPAPSGWREAPGGLDDLFAGYDAATPSPQPPHAQAMSFSTGADEGGAPVAYGDAAPAPAGPPMPMPMPMPTRTPHLRMMAPQSPAAPPPPAPAPAMRPSLNPNPNPNPPARRTPTSAGSTTPRSPCPAPTRAGPAEAAWSRAAAAPLRPPPGTGTARRPSARSPSRRTPSVRASRPARSTSVTTSPPGWTCRPTAGGTPSRSARSRWGCGASSSASRRSRRRSTARWCSPTLPTGRCWPGRSRSAWTGSSC